jgi:hypothetical protein
MPLLSKSIKGIFNQQAKVSAEPTGSTAGRTGQPSANLHLALLKQTLHHNDQTWLKLYQAMDTAG